MPLEATSISENIFEEDLVVDNSLSEQALKSKTRRAINPTALFIIIV